MNMLKRGNCFEITSRATRYFSFLLVLALHCSGSAQTKEAHEIDSYVKPLVKANQFYGVILATRKGKIIYEKAFGMAQAEHGVPNRIDTRFGIASVTKSMTQAIALRLVAEGKLGVQDRLGKWLSDFPSGEEITLQMLIEHRSGIPHRGTTEEEETVRYTPADMIEKAKRASLVFRPGERRLYSSLGYSVLARVLELASGKNFAHLLQECVFLPAGIKDSVDFNGEMILPRRAQEYFLEPAGIAHAPLKDYSFLVGAGSVFSTARDVFMFGKSVMDGKYGADVEQALSDKGVFRDNGVTNGFRCYVMIDRQKDFGFVVISNLQSGANDLLVRDLQNILQDKMVSLPKPPDFKVNKMPTVRLKEYVGDYKFETFTNRIVLKGDQLVSGDYKIFPIGDGLFYRFADYATLTFIRNADATIRGLEWQGVDSKVIGTKQTQTL